MREDLVKYKNIIYLIRNKINNKVYVGKSVRSFKERYHRGIEKHHNPHLRKSIQKYGTDNFEIVILEKEINDINKLSELEIYYINLYKSYNPKYGYNKTYGGDGVKHTDETKLKTSKALKGKPKSEAHKATLSKARKGINPLASMTEEQLKQRSEKLSKATSGKNNPMYGRTRDKMKKETLEKLSKASSGENNPMYGKNIKDYMTPEAYEQWKKNVARTGRMNGMAKKTIIIYMNVKYEFDYAEKGIEYFKKEKNEPITRNWFYRGINPKYKDKFQFVGYEEEYFAYLKTQS